jgi:hypothetical protein
MYLRGVVTFLVALVALLAPARVSRDRNGLGVLLWFR